MSTLSKFGITKKDDYISSQNEFESINKGNLAASSLRPIVITLIAVGAVIIITLSISIPIINSNKKKLGN